MKYTLIAFMILIASCESTDEKAVRFDKFIYGEYVKRGDELWKLRNDSFFLKKTLDELRADTFWIQVGGIKIPAPKDRSYQVSFNNWDSIVFTSYKPK
jgi:hypothetical protein